MQIHRSEEWRKTGEGIKEQRLILWRYHCTRMKKILAKMLFGEVPPPGETSVPAGLRVYAVGDIHGELSALDDLLGKIAADLPDLAARGIRPVVVFLGDYVDRGPDSRGVLDRLSADPLPGAECRFLMGNHEDAVLAALADPRTMPPWLQFGGGETLASYGIRVGHGSRSQDEAGAALARAMPERHRAFLAGLELSAIYGDYAFVHAGIRPGRPIEQQDRDDLLWIRDPFLGSRRWHGKVVVHGHTIVERPELLANRIAIDTGAYATGILSCLVLEGTGRRILAGRSGTRS